MSIPSDREIIKIISRTGGLWYDFEREFARRVIARAQQIAIEEGIKSSAFRGGDDPGDDQGREYFKNFQTKLLPNGDIYFYNEARHAEWLELGNEANGPGGYIYPKKAKKLRFKATMGPFKGRFIYVDRVKTIEARHIMEKATHDILRQMT